MINIDPLLFARQSVLQQHRSLARLARQILEQGADLALFETLSERMMSQTDFISPKPPPWLSEKEALEVYVDFHKRYDPYPPTRTRKEVSASNHQWQAVYPVEIILDQVRNAYNLGAVIRLVDNFGFEGVVHNLAGLSPAHRHCRLAAGGAEAWIPVRYEPDLEAYVQQNQRPLAVLECDPRAIEIQHWRPPRSLMLVLGNESRGTSAFFRTRAQYMLKISSYGYKKSMNVSTACAIAGQRIITSLKPLPRGAGSLC